MRAALQSRGLQLRHEHLIEMPHKIIEGQMAMKALMNGSERPTAVICGTDLLAIGALAEARESGIDVPGDCRSRASTTSSFPASRRRR